MLIINKIKQIKWDQWSQAFLDCIEFVQKFRRRALNENIQKNKKKL